MSAQTVQAKIRSNPKFAELVAKRTRFAIILTFVVLVPYYSYMAITSFAPQVLAEPFAGVITLGWPVGVVMVVGAWLLTGIYTRRANGEFDAMTEEILREAQK